jgi:TetR/AcrR family transcriptional regulator, cholesterol catabolism regulator
MEVHEKIIEEAGKLFVKNGVRQVTMDLIAQSLGISKRTIYENFRDKNDLLRIVLTVGAIEHKKKMLEIMKDAPNVIEALFRFGEFNRRFFENVNPLFFEEIEKYHPNIFTEIVQNDQLKNSDISYTLLKRGVNEGIFVKTIDIDIANLFIHNVMDSFQTQKKAQKIEHKKIWISVFLPYLKGICTQKGIELLNSFLSRNENLTQC